MTQGPKRIGEVLQEMGLVTEAQIKEALLVQKTMPTKKLAEILMDMGLVKPIQVGEALMKQWEERVERCHDKGLVVKGIRNILGKTDSIFDLQKKLVDAIDELGGMKDDLESLYQVCVAIARDRMLSLMKETEEPS